VGVRRKQHSAEFKACPGEGVVPREFSEEFGGRLVVDDIAFWGEDPGGAGGGVWGSSDDDQQLEAGAGEACGGTVRARQQGAGGR